MTETETTRKWRERVGSWRASGLTAAEFCARHGGAVNTLRYWASRLNGSAPVGLPKTVRMIKVTPTERRHGALVIELDHARVVVDAGLDRALLAMVIDVLDARRSR